MTMYLKRFLITFGIVCGLVAGAGKVFATCYVYNGSASTGSDTLYNAISVHNSGSSTCKYGSQNVDLIWPDLNQNQGDQLSYQGKSYQTIYLPKTLTISAGARSVTIGDPDSAYVTIIDGTQEDLNALFCLSTNQITFQNVILYVKTIDQVVCSTSAYTLDDIKTSGLFEVYAADDQDGDGYTASSGDDCDDTNAAINPGATETPDNSVDENCDGTYAFDSDDDTYSIYYSNGNKSGSQVEPEGVKVDCDDTVATVHPDAQETANDTDDDCDGIVDETTSYYDDDGDGYCEAYDRNIAGTDHRCLSADKADVNGDGAQDAKDADCNDANGGIKPLASESQDDIDNNCNGLIDEGYAGEDADGDGYVAGATVDPDCDDTDPDVHPGATEIPGNGINEDCDAETDEGYSPDSDNDGYSDDIDCNDSDPTINPGANETKNNTTDEDCDGLYAYDRDGDTYVLCYSNANGTGTASSSNVCDDQLKGNDCDDANDTIHPGAYDKPDDGVDQDCSGVDTVSTDDNDGDGYQASVDCDDVDPSIHPGATELANNDVDEDCDGLYTYDADHDGYSITTDDDGDIVDATLDCDDSNPSVYTGHAELADNGIDDNCDGQIDEVGGAPNPDDQDNDGFEISVDCNDNDPAINPVAVELAGNTVDENCDGLYAYDRDSDNYEAYYTAADGTGAVTSQPEDDCDDSASAVNPGVTEVPDNGVDDNCNDQIDEVGLDADGDGYPSTVDCKDDNAAVHPNAVEDTENGIDDDCDGETDETTGGGNGGDGGDGGDGNGGDGDGGGSDSSIDEDKDGYTKDIDCDDADVAVNPGASEGFVADGKDNDCNGIVDDVSPCDTSRDDLDCDEDGIVNGADNCDTVANLPVSDTNGDGAVNTSDAQADYDADTLGDACDDNPCGIPDSIDEETRDTMLRECYAAMGTVIPPASESESPESGGGSRGACALSTSPDAPVRSQELVILALAVLLLALARRSVRQM